MPLENEEMNMSEFKIFKDAVEEQFKKMSQYDLFVTDTSKDFIWKKYLTSFPEGTNPIFRERTEHDCQCCKQFLRAAGNVVTIINGAVESIWDVSVPHPYQDVANALSKYVKSKNVRDVFLHKETHAGTNYNYDTKAVAAPDPVIRWNHFYIDLPARIVDRDKDTALSIRRSNKEVFKRSLDGITLEASETVLELIEQNSIYRGEEHKSIVELFVKHKRIYDDLSSKKKKDLYSWEVAQRLGNGAKIRNTVIGTLLSDISEGVELDAAVRSFEAKVAPQNYKRPTALITQGMIDKAKEKVAELGIEGSLERRYAVTGDITINNVLFADRSVKKSMGVFDELSDGVKVDAKKFDKVEEVAIDEFIEHVLPKATKLELFMDNKHSGNLMSLVAPVNLDAPNMLKWNNNFSWAYNGDVTDSIKERVKRAGGNVEGDFRCSLSWFNYDDLDIHIIEPNGNRIYFSRKQSGTGGTLDVDMNAGGGNSRNAVENITWQDERTMLPGGYKLLIHNYAKRENVDVGFTVEMEYKGRVWTFGHDKPLKNGERVTVAEFDFNQADGVKFINSIDSVETSKELWGINTQKFHTVRTLMNSPNHWDGNKTGNKHWFFILDGCKNEGKARGFFNEFLKAELTEHRKVFEVLSSKMKAAESDEQLSGLGFSSTKRDSVLCKVTGSFSRIIKINF